MLEPVVASFATTATSAMANALVPLILSGFALAPITGWLAGAGFHEEQVGRTQARVARNRVASFGLPAWRVPNGLLNSSEETAKDLLGAFEVTNVEHAEGSGGHRAHRECVPIRPANDCEVSAVRCYAVLFVVGMALDVGSRHVAE